MSNFEVKNKVKFNEFFMEAWLKKFIRTYRWIFLIATIITVIDQITKILIRKYIPYGGQWAPWDWMLPYVRLLHINNTGAAFGLFKNANPVLMGLAVLVSIAILYYYPRVPVEEKVVRFALSLQLAGALGNLIDRIIFSKVTDFISLGNFAIFNVADSSITIGVIILLISVWWQDRKDKKKIVSNDPQETVNESGSEH